MRKFSTKIGVTAFSVVAVIAGLLFLASSATAQQKHTRVIPLERTFCAVSECPASRATLIPWETAAASGNLQLPFLELNIVRLGCLEENRAGVGKSFWTLYVTPNFDGIPGQRDDGRLRLFSFNTSCIRAGFQGDVVLPVADDRWFTEPITIEVFREEDDGLDAPEAPGSFGPSLIGVD